jgi:hypothetical protein
MSRFGFVFCVRFWVAVWIVILFVGLLPLPPAAELIILVGFVAHCLWFIQRRLRQAARLRALARAARAEEEEYRRLRRRRALQDGVSTPPVGGELTWH